ncbi:hypothetical protein KRR39_12440 [Nocardioides panacis]|uniref:Uncharacterized protein n=1 Tax=Nocardioides panacis TaxID=2849501 RepID=A0A975SW34_9ACTN|nr:hypothetical protein [Nocardioides panacis]QWZ06408.1 hypothetical protein KRR39_12440 [Nocardioides panacis]
MTRSRLVLVLVLLLALLGTGLVLRAGERPAETRAASPEPDVGADVGAVDVPAADVLRAWDEQRAAAYAAGSVRQLRRLYVARSAAARSDLHVLTGYRRRGLVVEGMRTQVLALRVLDERPRRLRLEVTDRLDGAVAVGAGRRVALPRDRPDARTVTLRRGADGAWRVVSVLPVRTPPTRRETAVRTPLTRRLWRRGPALGRSGGEPLR